jgi:regulator of sigma E protease
MNWIAAILAIGVLIIVHESGHYVVARLCKMRVERFSIGFGPAIASWRSKKTGTQFQLAPIPFGGFVEIKGMNIVEEVDPADAEAYPNRPVWQRFLTIFAGPATNYLFATLLAFTLFNCAGMLTDENPHKIESVMSDAPAEGHLRAGDDIVAVDGQPLDGRAVIEALDGAGDRTVAVEVIRDGQHVTVEVHPTRGLLLEYALPHIRDPGTQAILLNAQVATAPRLGVLLQVPRQKVGIGTAAYQAIIYPARQTQVILTGLYEWYTGKAEGRVSSVVGITSEAKKAIEEGWISTLLFLMLLNVFLGLFNLFPLPALDGGRLVFLVYEMVTRRRANPKLEATIHMVGVLVLAVLLVVVTVNDCRHL